MSGLPSEEERGCLNCGSPNVEWTEGSYDSGVRGPCGEVEWLHESGWGCADCGAVEDRLGALDAAEGKEAGA